MGTIAEKLEYLNNTKTAIKESIVAKGGIIAENDTFRSYAEKISNLPTGGTAPTGTNEWKYNPEWFDRDAILAEAPVLEGYGRIFSIVNNKNFNGHPLVNYGSSFKFYTSSGEIINGTDKIDLRTITDNNNWKTLSDGTVINWYILYTPNSIIYLEPRHLYIYIDKKCVEQCHKILHISTNYPSIFLEALETEDNIPLTLYTLNYLFKDAVNLKKVSEIIAMKETGNISSSYVDFGAAFNNCVSLNSVKIIIGEEMYFSQGNMFANCHNINFTIINSHYLKAFNNNTTFIFNNMGKTKVLPYIDYTTNSNGGITSLSFLTNAKLLESIEGISPIIINNNIYINSLYSINRESIIKILKALNDRTGLTSCSISLGAALSLLTDEDKAIALNKNWTLS